MAQDMSQKVGMAQSFTPSAASSTKLMVSAQTAQPGQRMIQDLFDEPFFEMQDQMMNNMIRRKMQPMDPAFECSTTANAFTKPMN